MSVFSSVPGYTRVSVLFKGLGLAAEAGPSSDLVGHARRAMRNQSEGHVGSDAAWREAYAAVGLDTPTVPPHEALAAWAATPTGVPSQGPLADLVNGFSVELAVPTAAYDLASVDGDMWLCPARGYEVFLPVDGARPLSPRVGELILVDSRARVMARRWHGAQGRAFVARGETTTAIVHVDLLPPVSDHAQQIADGLIGLVTAALGGSGEAALICRSAPIASWRVR